MLSLTITLIMFNIPKYNVIAFHHYLVLEERERERAWKRDRVRDINIYFVRSRSVEKWKEGKRESHTSFIIIVANDPESVEILFVKYRKM